MNGKIPEITEFTGWRKGGDSDDTGCVYIADGPDGWIALRESEDPSGAIVRIPRRSWKAFTNSIKNDTLKA